MKKSAPYTLHASKQVRVILDTDTACEVDDLFAIAQTLLTPKFDVRAICPENLGLRSGPHTQEESWHAAKEMVELMGLSEKVPVLHGCDVFKEDGSFAPSEASDFIVQEAMREDERPLYVIILGAVSNVAAALLTEPAIAERMLLIGGRIPDGTWYFNSCNDHVAYNVLLDSTVEWWTVDMPEGAGFQASLMTLYETLRPLGAFGSYLYDRVLWASDKLTKHIAEDVADGRMGMGMSKAALAAFLPSGETWAFWDCASVGLAMYSHMGLYRETPAPHLLDESGRTLERPEHPHKIRSYYLLDSPMIMDDMFAKFRYHYGSDNK